VPSVLIHVDAERLAALRAHGWVVRRGEVVPDGLMRPPDWTLYLTAVCDGEVHVVGYLEGAEVERDELGTATACDVDVTPVIDRLGCDGGPDAFARWASGPVVLTKNDADLLRWRLGLPLDVVVPPPRAATPPPPPALPTGFEHDATALALVRAVYADLTSDASRMVLADRLLELGDPRGELIALQLARARLDTPSSARERALLAQHGTAWTQPLAEYLSAFEFRRGFLASATVDERVAMPPALIEHVAWSTVDDLETRNVELLLSPALRSLRRVAVTTETLAALAAHREPLQFEAVVGARVPAGGGRVVQGGVALHADTLQAVMGTSSLVRVRSLSVSLETPGQTENATQLLASDVGRRIQHLELFRSRLPGVDVEGWMQVFRRNGLLSLGLRGFVEGWMIAIVRHASTLVVQLGLPPRPRAPSFHEMFGIIERAGQGVARATLEQVGDGPQIDLEPLGRALGRTFRRIELARTLRWRTP